MELLPWNTKKYMQYVCNTTVDSSHFYHLHTYMYIHVHVGLYELKQKKLYFYPPTNYVFFLE